MLERSLSRRCNVCSEMIPEEVLIDIFKWLDRMNIDMLQLVSTSFCHVIDENISDVCLRWIPAMTVRSARNSPYRLDIYEDPSYATSIRIGKCT